MQEASWNREEASCPELLYACCTIVLGNFGVWPENSFARATVLRGMLKMRFPLSTGFREPLSR